MLLKREYGRVRKEKRAAGRELLGEKDCAVGRKKQQRRERKKERGVSLMASMTGH